MCIFILGLILMTVILVCKGYVYAPLITLFGGIFFVLPFTWVVIYEPLKTKSPCEKRSRNFFVGFVAAAFIGLIFPCHWICGAKSLDGINVPVERQVTSLKTGGDLVYLDRDRSHFNNIYFDNIHVDVPSSAALSPDVASFKPISVIENKGPLSGLANWISDQRKLVVEVSQGENVFSGVFTVRDWYTFVKTAYSPQQEADEAADRESESKADDAKLDVTISSGKPL